MTDQDAAPPVYTDAQISAMKETRDSINDAIFKGTVDDDLLDSLEEKADGISAILDSLAEEHLEDNAHDLGAEGEEMVPIQKLVDGLKAEEAGITAKVADGGAVLSAVAKLISVFA